MCKTWLEWLSHRHCLALAIVNKCIHFISLLHFVKRIRMFGTKHTFQYTKCALKEMICTFVESLSVCDLDIVYPNSISAFYAGLLLISMRHWSETGVWGEGSLWTTILQGGHRTLRAIYVMSDPFKCGIIKIETHKMPENVLFLLLLLWNSMPLKSGWISR